MLKRLSASALILLLLLAGCKETPSGTSSAQTDLSTSKEVALETQEQKISYAVGLDIGTSFTRNGASLDLDALLMGVKDGQDQREPRLSREEISQTVMEFQQMVRAKQEEKLEAMRAEQKAASAAYLAEFAQKPGAVVLDSGLIYIEEQEGSGAQPGSTDTVKVHYRGTTVDGNEFDSSYERGEPVEFRVDQVIPGWTEALQLMHTGAKWQLVIPANLAYGEQGRGGVIPPGAALVFEVELLEVVPAQEETDAAEK